MFVMSVLADRRHPTKEMVDLLCAQPSKKLFQEYIVSFLKIVYKLFRNTLVASIEQKVGEVLKMG